MALEYFFYRKLPGFAFDSNSPFRNKFGKSEADVEVELEVVETLEIP